MRGQGERGTRWTAAVACLAALAVAATLLTGCVGATDRRDFDDQLQQQSGGISGLLVERSIDAVGRHLGTDRLSMRRFSVDGRSRRVTMEVVDPRDPSKLDTYVFHDDELEAPQPILVTGSTSIERDTFRVQEVAALDAVGSLVRVALGRLGIEGASASRLTVQRSDGQDVRLRLDAASARSAGTAVFDGEGKLLEATRS